MRDPQTDPAIRHRLAVVRYARKHSIAAAARKFGHCWATVKAHMRRVEVYQTSGDIRALQNRPRGDPGRTPGPIEDQVVAIYQESARPARPGRRRYSAPKVGRLLAQRQGVELDRSTVWSILRRRGVWVPPRSSKQAIQRFERSKPNDLWQIDLVEDEPTAIGPVQGVVITDDCSRDVVGLGFFFTKQERNVLLTLYQAFEENGTPAEIISDGGSQFAPTSQQGTTQFQDILAALGIAHTVAPSAQTKGKIERKIQFVERDFLDEVRWAVRDLKDLNARADAWRHSHNHTHRHATTRTTPAARYRPGLRLDEQLLRETFATQERRKVSREATVRYLNRVFPVPSRYIGWQVWVSNFFDREIEIHAGTNVIARFDLSDFGGDSL